MNIGHELAVVGHHFGMGALRVIGDVAIMGVTKWRRSVSTFCDAYDMRDGDAPGFVDQWRHSSLSTWTCKAYGVSNAVQKRIGPLVNES